MKLKNNLIFASKCDILILECMDVVVIVTVLVLYAVKLWKGNFFIPQGGGYPPYYYHESAGMFCYIDFATTHLVYE